LENDTVTMLPPVGHAGGPASGTPPLLLPLELAEPLELPLLEVPPELLPLELVVPPLLLVVAPLELPPLLPVSPLLLPVPPLPPPLLPVSPLLLPEFELPSPGCGMLVAVPPYGPPSGSSFELHAVYVAAAPTTRASLLRPITFS
jgi:hypothetical protein